MNVAIDTNVVVCGLLKPFSPAGQIMRWVAEGAICVCYDARILLEYEQVLRHEKFGFDAHAVAVLIDVIRETGLCVAGAGLNIRLPDPTDEMFIEVASAAECRLLITGNSKHLPPKACQGIAAVYNPRNFVELFKRRQSSIKKGLPH